MKPVSDAKGCVKRTSTDHLHYLRGFRPPRFGAGGTMYVEVRPDQLANAFLQQARIVAFNAHFALYKIVIVGMTEDDYLMQCDCRGNSSAPEPATLSWKGIPLEFAPAEEGA